MAHISPLTDTEFRDRVGFVAYQLERAEISVTLAASDLRRLVAGRTKGAQVEDSERAMIRSRQEWLATLQQHAAADVFALVQR